MPDIPQPSDSLPVLLDAIYKRLRVLENPPLPAAATVQLVSYGTTMGTVTTPNNLTWMNTGGGSTSFTTTGVCHVRIRAMASGQCQTAINSTDNANVRIAVTGPGGYSWASAPAAIGSLSTGVAPPGGVTFVEELDLNTAGTYTINFQMHSGVNGDGLTNVTWWMDACDLKVYQIT